MSMEKVKGIVKPKVIGQYYVSVVRTTEYLVKVEADSKEHAENLAKTMTDKELVGYNVWTRVIHTHVDGDS